MLFFVVSRLVCVATIVRSRLHLPISVSPLDLSRPPHEHPLHFLSEDDLVFYHGDRRGWWGDLSAKETRLLYHALLPTYYPLYLHDHDPETLARMTASARASARAYARRRARLHVRWASFLFDCLRRRRYDAFRIATGTDTALRVLESSCRTNPTADWLCGTRRNDFKKSS